MSTAFVAQLRTGRPPIRLQNAGADAITLRVEASDIWETVRVVTPPDAPGRDNKQRVVSELFSDRRPPGQFVLKLRGWEILDEQETLSQAGVVDGTILLLAYRRRRPVR
jgi:hypothetical protein